MFPEHVSGRKKELEGTSRSNAITNTGGLQPYVLTVSFWPALGEMVRSLWKLFTCFSQGPHGPPLIIWSLRGVCSPVKAPTSNIPPSSTAETPPCPRGHGDRNGHGHPCWTRHVTSTSPRGSHSNHPLLAQTTGLRFPTNQTPLAL